MDGAFVKPYYDSALANTLANFPNLAFLFECNEATGTPYAEDSILGLRLTETTGGQQTVTNNGDGTITPSGGVPWNELTGTLPSPGTKNIVGFWIGKPDADMATPYIIIGSMASGGFRLPIPDGASNGASGGIRDATSTVLTGTVFAVNGNSSAICGGFVTVDWGSATGLNAGVCNGTTFEALTAGNIATKTTLAAIAQNMSLPTNARPALIGAFYTDKELPSQAFFKAALLWMVARCANGSKPLYPGFANL